MIKANEIESEKKEFDFPKLMINDSGVIVLMTEKNCGITIKHLHSLTGRYYNDWSMTYFKDYHGIIQLQNTEGE